MADLPLCAFLVASDNVQEGHIFGYMVEFGLGCSSRPHLHVEGMAVVFDNDFNDLRVFFHKIMVADQIFYFPDPV